MGLRDETVKEQVCRFWVEDVYAYSLAAVKKYVTELSHLPREKASIICLAPLERAVFQPDLVLVRCDPEQAMLLLWSYVYNTGEVIRGETGGRYNVGLSSEELMVSTPYPLLKNMITALQQHIKDWKGET